MIRSSAFVKAGVIIVSAALHVGIMTAFYEEQTVEVAGGATGAINARLGNSFADLVQGTQAPQTPDPALVAETPSPAESAPVTPTQTVTPATSALAAVPLSATAPTLSTLMPQTITAQSQTQAPAEPETVTATTESAVETSQRPVARPQKPVQPPPLGNSQQNATAGSDTGNTNATARQQSSTTPGRSSDAGNAAATNYPGEVNRRIRRVGQPRVRDRGLVVVQFAINANGGLASVSVVQSSGSARLDRAAMQVIQRASPFPPPPQGAQRSFRMEIERR